MRPRIDWALTALSLASEIMEEAMKWMLFVLVFGSHPVETNLLYDNLDACLKAEETMRKEYARAYSQGTWGTAVGESSDPSLVSPFWAKDLRNLHSACVRR
jgi:predicted urease superfamily metal-dependent hydrolase